MTAAATIECLHKNCCLMGEGMVLLIVKDVNILMGIFLLRKMNKFLAVGQDFVNLLGGFFVGENEQIFGCWVGVSLIPKVFIKIQEQGGPPPQVGGKTWSVQRNNIKGGDILVRWVHFWAIILLDTILYYENQFHQDFSNKS